MIMTPRIKAFIVHFLISVVVALAAMLVVFGLWYPSPLDAALGVTSIFLLLLFVDVVLGPCLTLVIFKPGKKTLVFDLGVIALLQISALAYGLWTVADGRPVWLVFAHDRFELVRASDVNSHFGEVQDEYKSVSWLGPLWVALPSFNGIDEQNALQWQAMVEGVRASEAPALYQSLESQKKAVQLNAHSLERLLAFNSESELAAVAVLAKYPQADSWLPLHAIEKDLVVLLNRDSAKVQGLVTLQTQAQ